MTRPLSPSEFTAALFVALRYLEINELGSQNPNGAAYARETAYPRGYACGLLVVDFYRCDYGNDAKAWQQFVLGLEHGSTTRQLTLQGGQQ